MKYYLVAPFSNSPLLVYSSKNPLKLGELVEIPLKNTLKKGVVYEECKAPSFNCKEAKSLDLFFLPHQIQLANFIAQYYCTSLGMAFSLFAPTKELYPPLIECVFSTPHKLSLEQEKIFHSIAQKPFSLLFGETGSGKSEIYIHLIIKVLKQGKNALLLMPEIALTPQMQQRLEKVFGKHIGVWHSKMSSSKKQELLKSIQEGTIRLVLGARSALFLPISNLGVIIVDEEHDEAYKAQNSPKYNARDLAIYLGKKQEIQILLGSATPSATSYFLAKSLNSILRLKKFYSSNNELRILKQKTELSLGILSSIQTMLDQQKQSILFLPTRANFKYLICLECGSNIKCPFCNISMSLHLNKKIMLCHYCGFSQNIPNTCPSCSSSAFYSQRIGTAQIAKDLQEYFPQAKIAIFDRDHITTQKKLENTLRDFSNGKIDILIGTQMLSKGHDYHNIGLAVIMGLDEILHFGDFRSRERAMSLFFQIKGRAGRKENGLVLLQTLNTDFFQCQDYESFLQSELEFRKDLYPPFSKLAILTFTHTNPNKAEVNMQKALDFLKQNPNIQIVGGGKARLEKINAKYRYMILLRCAQSTPLLKAIHSLPFPCEIDIDPLNIV